MGHQADLDYELVVGTTDHPEDDDNDGQQSLLWSLLSGGLIGDAVRIFNGLWESAGGSGRRGAPQPVVLSKNTARQHLFCIGRTGVGKSQWLVSLILQLLNQMIGVLVIDPHGDLIDLTLAQLHDQGYFADPRAFTTDRLKVVDFANPNAFVPWNVLKQPTMTPDRVSAATMEAFRRAFPDLASSQAPLIESYIQYGSWALCCAGEPLTQLARLVTDLSYRTWVVSHIEEPPVSDWFEQLEASGRRGVTQAESSLRRLNLLTLSPELQYSLGNHANILPMRSILDRGTSLLVNLGGLPTASKRLIGSLLAVHAEEAALSRADIPEESRRPYVLVIDEAGQFMSRSAESLEVMLSQTRKYHLWVIAAVQYLKMFPSEIRSALVNTNLCTFRADIDDADWLARRLGHFDPDKLKYSPSGTPSYVSEGEQTAQLAREIASLPPRQAIIRLGDRSIPFRTLDVPSPHANRAAVAAIKAEYARRFLVPREQIMADLKARSVASHQQQRDADAQERSADRVPHPGQPGQSRRVVPRRGFLHRAAPEDI